MKQFKENYINKDTWDLDRLKKASKAMGPLGEFLEFVTEYQKQQDKNQKLKNNKDVLELNELRKQKSLVQKNIDKIKNDLKVIESQVGEEKARKSVFKDLNENRFSKDQFQFIDDLIPAEVSQNGFDIDQFQGYFKPSLNVEKFKSSPLPPQAQEDIGIDCRLMNDYIQGQLNYLTPPIYEDNVIEHEEACYDFYNNQINKKINELSKFYNKEKQDNSQQCDLMNEQVKEMLNVLQPPCQLRDIQDASEIEKEILNQNNKIHHFYQQQMDQLKYQIKSTVLNIQKINEYLVNTFNYQIRPFEKDEIVIDDDQIQNQFIEKMEQIRKLFEKKNGMRIKKLNEYFQQSGVGPIDKDELAFDEEDKILVKIQDFNQVRIAPFNDIIVKNFENVKPLNDIEDQNNLGIKLGQKLEEILSQQKIKVEKINLFLQSNYPQIELMENEIPNNESGIDQLHQKISQITCLQNCLDLIHLNQYIKSTYEGNVEPLYKSSTEGLMQKLQEIDKYYQSQKNPLNVTKLNNYIEHNYLGEIEPFDHYLQGSDDEINIKLIHKFEDMLQKKDKKASPIDITQLNEYIQKMFQGNIPPFDSNEFSPQDVQDMIQKIELIRDYQRNKDEHLYKSQAYQQAKEEYEDELAHLQDMLESQKFVIHQINSYLEQNHNHLKIDEDEFFLKNGHEQQNIILQIMKEIGENKNEEVVKSSPLGPDYSEQIADLQNQLQQQEQLFKEREQNYKYELIKLSSVISTKEIPQETESKAIQSDLIQDMIIQQLDLLNAPFEDQDQMIDVFRRKNDELRNQINNKEQSQEEATIQCNILETEVITLLEYFNPPLNQQNRILYGTTIEDLILQKKQTLQEFYECQDETFHKYVQTVDIDDEFKIQYEQLKEELKNQQDNFEIQRDIYIQQIEQLKNRPLKQEITSIPLKFSNTSKIQSQKKNFRIYNEEIKQNQYKTERVSYQQPQIREIIRTASPVEDPNKRSKSSYTSRSRIIAINRYEKEEYEQKYKNRPQFFEQQKQIQQLYNSNQQFEAPKQQKYSSQYEGRKISIKDFYKQNQIDF